VTDGRGDSRFLEGILELGDHDLGRRLISIPHDTLSWIVRDEVHMCETSLKELRELMSKLWTIGDSGDHDILVEYAFIRLRYIGIERCHEIRDWIRILDGHDTLASLIIGRMERYCE
jgi:hypothetical protein